jgi:DNA-binding NarL/FixJ family response regulator
MRPRQVLLVGMPRLLRDLVHEIVSLEGDLEIVGEVGPDSALPAGLAPDFVLVGIDDPGRLEAQLAVLQDHPRARILAVSGDGRDAAVCELRPQRVELGEISPTMLLAAIRAPDWRRVVVD